MSNIVTGGTIPDDLKSVLERYGIDFDNTLSFVLRCDGPGAPLLITSTTYVEEKQQDGVALRTETRTFKLLAVE